jgi:hypothetical protein
VNRPIDIHGILERAGADADAPEGSQAWALAQVSAAVDELVDSTSKVVRYIDSAHGDSFREEIAKCVLPGDLAVDRLHAALAAVGGAK